MTPILAIDIKMPTTMNRKELCVHFSRLYRFQLYSSILCFIQSPWPYIFSNKIAAFLKVYWSSGIPCLGCSSILSLILFEVWYPSFLIRFISFSNSFLSLDLNLRKSCYAICEIPVVFELSYLSALNSPTRLSVSRLRHVTTISIIRFVSLWLRSFIIKLGCNSTGNFVFIF